MSWPTTTKYYKEIVEDPTLLQLFSLEEYSSIQELQCLGTLQLRLIAEGFLPTLFFPTIGERLGWNFSPQTSLKRSRETTNLVILITNGVIERDLGMVMVFCYPNQAKMEACDTLSALHQCDTSEQGMVVVSRYSYTPYIPQWTSCSLYLDVGTLSGGTSSAQFPLDRLCLC